MKKRLLALLITAIMCISVFPAYAADWVVSVKPSETHNLSEDMITVSGEAPIDGIVTIIIYNPNKSEEDVLYDAAAENSGAIQYFGTAYAQNGRFTKDIKIHTRDAYKIANGGEGGGVYTLTAKTGSQSATVPFTFYAYESKLSLVTSVQNLASKTEAEGLIDTIAKNYGRSLDPLYTSGNKVNIAHVFYTMSKADVPQTPDDVLSLLNKAMVVSGFNNNNPLVFTSGKIADPALLGINGTDIYTDYTTALSATGIQNVNNALVNMNVESTAALKTRFNDYVLLNLLTNNILSGSGHFEGLFAKYETLYEAAGFKVDLYTAAANKRELETYMQGISKSTLSEYSVEFNKLVTPTVTEEDPYIPPSGGGGGFSGGGGAPVKTPDFVNNEQPPKQVSAGDFNDVSAEHWAYDAIDQLCKEGVISGKDAQTFAPDDNITRAEFTKLIVAAFEIAAEGNAEFADVASTAWYYEYVAKAAAAGIVNGSGGSFAPEQFITRQDAAVIIARALQLAAEEGEITFADGNSIADYAKDAVLALTKLGIINGMGDNTFCPTDYITRAQAAMMLSKA